ncbi:cell division protein FtsQ/DivIB [Caldicellulosiruptor naganoensis]|uniref:FtsQ-type POTRA domain-containing protein n=1 Tax=Caldicellulosiruptor naganoensis TaxID=29324 RepID=A0ABY7BHA1_9FIRM|nr:FtsQ-type POTRA domain-containing protein [Caldicellulosiruptor naganoensis]WAM31110.1 FtsQ-type POTRA domain-containing protein [Caldicellulosiruptor naganoensis]
MGRLVRKIIVLLLLVLITLVFVFRLDYFNVKEFSIHNLKRVKKDDIIKILQQYQNQNILSINTKEIRQKLLENPEIEDIRITRRLPNVLVLEIYEKETIGLIKYLNSYIEIDKNGYVIRIEGDLPKKTIVFEGLKVNEAMVGKKLDVEDHLLLDEGLQVASSLKNFDVFRKFDVDHVVVLLKNINNVELKMDKLLVKVGDISEIDYKLKLLKSVYDKLPKRIEGTITLNSNGIATFSPNTEEEN